MFVGLRSRISWGSLSGTKMPLSGPSCVTLLQHGSLLLQRQQKNFTPLSYEKISIKSHHIHRSCSHSRKGDYTIQSKYTKGWNLRGHFTILYIINHQQFLMFLLLIYTQIWLLVSISTMGHHPSPYVTTISFQYSNSLLVSFPLLLPLYTIIQD